MRGDTVVFVGDYVDRGPSAHDVIELLLDRERKGGAEFVFLKGNHEDMMCAFLGLPGNYGESFLFNGGAATIDSYGVTERELPEARGHIPEAHLDFVKRLATSYLRPPYFFVHAGIVPALSSRSSASRTCSGFARNYFQSASSWARPWSSGIPRCAAVMIDLPYKLGIDTGLVYGGKLTCIEFTEGVITSRPGQPSGENQHHRLAARLELT